MAGARLWHSQWDVVVVSAAVLAVGAAFVTWRVATPAACAWLGPDAASWTPRGLVPKLPAGCLLPSTLPIVDAASSTHETRLTFADGSAATLPEAGFLAAVPQRLVEGAWTLLFTVAQFALCLFGFVRQPHDRGIGAALVFSAGLLSSTAVTILGLPVGAAFAEGPRWLFLAATQGTFSILWGAALLLIVLFPTPMSDTAGRLRNRAAVASAPLVLWLIVTAAIAATTGEALTRVSYAIRAQSSITLFTMLTIISTALVRMIRMRGDTAEVVARQQVLWLGGAGLSALMLSLSFWIVPHAALGAPLLPDDLIGLPGLLFVGGLAVALLRVRMFELEWLLVRVLVATTLVMLALGVYLVLLGTIDAASLPLEPVSAGVVATIVIALAAPALRRRVEWAVNWVVYRDPESPYHTLSRVAEGLGGRSVDFSRAADDIRRALRLPHVRIQAEGVVAESGSPDAVRGATPVAFPLDGGTEAGRLVVATRGRGDRLTAAEDRLLHDLARQIGTAVNQLRLSAELQHSREQLVLAREEERRAIRRVMHDDLAPTLAGIALQTETARQLLGREPAASEGVAGVLDAISRDARSTSASLRALSYELRPPALDDRGLVAALADAGVRLAPTEVKLDAVELGDLDAAPLPAAVEVAGYRIATAAMANVARHACADTCWVTLARTPSALRVRVADDGRGLAEGWRPGVGVASMRERAAELGGICTIGGRPGGGVQVEIELPLGEGR